MGWPDSSDCRGVDCCVSAPGSWPIGYSFISGCDCFPTWLFVRTLYCHISGGNNIVLYLSGLFCTELREMGLRHTVQLSWKQIWKHQWLLHVSSIFFIRMRASEKLLLTEFCVFNITLQGNRSLFSGQLPGVMFFYLLRYLYQSAIISPTISNISHKNGQKVE